MYLDVLRGFPLSISVYLEIVETLLRQCLMASKSRGAVTLGYMLATVAVRYASVSDGRAFSFAGFAPSLQVRRFTGIPQPWQASNQDIHAHISRSRSLRNLSRGSFGSSAMRVLKSSDHWSGVWAYCLTQAMCAVASRTGSGAGGIRARSFASNARCRAPHARSAVPVVGRFPLTASSPWQAAGAPRWRQGAHSAFRSS
jgi:hypothetical protein